MFGIGIFSLTNINLTVDDREVVECPINNEKCIIPYQLEVNYSDPLSHKLSGHDTVSGKVGEMSSRLNRSNMTEDMCT